MEHTRSLNLFLFGIFLAAHTPDNSFLGFVVGSNRREATPLAKKNIGLVYGKELYMWQVTNTVNSF